ncbi:hypothetical protein GCM10010222_69690 [Streptomyces tanashiensis]|uniref:hypothetical protein n=1 Tax=Streptomyces tanashiensis TaxID=67367 RepID=UPI001676C93B|nr:hypothetical protein [Streptomyces tanashiensis]GGT17841.1 hypothetical protein GCM10010222_69690 [Streptomyces tanashiensis]
MTGPDQNRNARPDERARRDERERHEGRDGRERQRYEDRYERQRHEAQNGGQHRGDGDEDPDLDLDRARDEEAEQVRGQGRQHAAATGGSAASGRPRGPLIGEYAPPYRRRSGRVAAVLLYRNGGHRVVWPDRTEDVNKPMFGSPYTVFEVRLGRNVTEFRLQLPAAGDGVFFDAVAKVQWVVTDPHLVVQEQVEDVAELLHDELLDGLRRLSRRFRITDAQRADEAVREELAAGRLSFGRDIGLRTRVLVFIDLDDSVKAEVSRRDRVGVTMEADQRVAEAERRREAADRALVAERATELEALFRRGDLAQIAHHMAMHPDKQWEIRTQLQQERREGQEDYLRVFNRLLDTGVLERHDIGEQMYQVLMYLRSQTGHVLGGITDRVLNPSGDTPRRRRALEEASPEPSDPDWDEDRRDAPRERWDEDHRDPRREPWDEDHGEAPRDSRVVEPTRVESGSERERERERERGRSRGRRDEGFDDGRDRYEPDSYERNDRYDRDDPYDRGGSERPRRPTRPARPSSAFDDWDEV